MALTMSLVEEKTNIDFISEQQTENHAKSLHVFTPPRHLDYIYAEGRVVALHVKNGNADSLYDPVICRFFSPDPFVQAPDFTQNFKIKTYKL